MKMSFSIVLSILYLAFNIGLGINVHYCGDRVDSVGLALVGSSCCCDSDEEPPGCCSDETFVFQSEDDQHASSSIQLSGIDNIDTGWAISCGEKVDSQIASPLADNGPPDIPDTPLFIRYSKLILYG